SGGITQCVSKIKSCDTDNLCGGQSGTKDFSLNVGTDKVLARAECCSTDDCNCVLALGRDFFVCDSCVSAPPTPGTGSLTCKRCNHCNQCNVNIDCNSLETKCFASTSKFYTRLRAKYMQGQSPL
uniref:Uncharacterized protein n=1 Tax=Neogobius melanostomus TaxID=47308 RepID=A0A8C6SJE8_9GOBI